MQTNKIHNGLNGGVTKNFIATAVDIVKQQGFFGLWRGSAFYILTCTPVNIIINALRPKILDEMIPNDYHERNEFYRFCVMLVSGFAADVLTLALTSPVSYVLTQISLDGLKLGSNFDFLLSANNAFSGLRDIILKNPATLYKGIGLLLLGKTIETAVTFLLSHLVQKKLSYNNSEGIFISNIGIKWMSQLIVYPFDSIQKRNTLLQTASPGAISSFKIGLSQGGLLDGFGVNIVRNNLMDFYYISYLSYALL